MLLKIDLIKIQQISKTGHFKPTGTLSLNYSPTDILTIFPQDSIH